MTHSTQDSEQTERLRRWRLILGGGEADGICGAEGGQLLNLGSGDMEMDQALAALYEQNGQRRGGLGALPQMSLGGWAIFASIFPVRSSGSCNRMP